MNGISIVLTVVLAVVIILAVRTAIKNKGKCSCCDGSCPGCSMNKTGKKQDPLK